ncbi:chloride channel [Lyophyllum atratum]|nr:chloride channel [Lyophyllum atratum]
MPDSPVAGSLAAAPIGPSSTTWRRQRLMRLGSSTTVNIPVNGGPDTPNQANTPDLSPTEHTFLQSTEASYGTLPTSSSRRSPAHPSPNLTSRRAIPQFPQLHFLRRTNSNPTTATLSSGLRDLAFSRLSTQRPISAYDAPLRSKDDSEPDADAKINGIRVWYSSFSSIDWLHDAIKDSVRFSRLRRRKSVRARIRLVIDKSLGWFVVTIVGFLTAIVAFLVVRSEQWLFDTKEGYCQDAWWKAKRFCCPALNDILLTSGGAGHPVESTCKEWRTWAEVFPGEQDDVGAILGEYTIYALIALCLALVSALLTIYLTNSTTFVTRKESGVLAPDFPDSATSSKIPSQVASSKRKVMYYAAGSGIPEIKTILSGFVIHGYLGGRVLFTKSVGLSLSVASGLSLGKEGPFVHIASCIGNIISRFFGKYENNEAKRREVLSAACAAGVAVAFGAPIGGTLFSLEEVSYFFPPKVMWRSFFCAMIAAITLKILDPFGTGKLVLFQVTYDKDWHAYELFPFVLLGVFGGVYGAYFSKLNYSWSKNIRNKTWLKSHPIAEVLLITAITTVLCFINPYTRMSGTELVYSLFSECHKGTGSQHSALCAIDPSTFGGIWPVIRAVSVAMIVKAGLTIVTFGIKVPAGIFVPSLGVGACAGRVLGIIMQWLQYKDPESRMFATCNGDMDCIIPGLYAMVGAAATLSGVTRTTVSLAVIMFELTDTLTYAVPVMLSVLVAKTVADALEPKGIYDLVIELNQLPYLDSKHEYLWGSLQINDVTARDVEAIRLDRKNTVKSLRDQLIALTASGNDDSGFPILRRNMNDEGMRMVGYIGASELEHALSLVADEAEDEVHFHTTYSHNMAASSFSSLMEESARPAQDLFDFSDYMDQAPLTVQSNSPLEMIHQFFVKLGARYVVVTDTEGLFEGVIDKKTWVAFLADLEEKS